MTTIAPTQDTQTQAGKGSGNPQCPGCRRCRNPEAPMCREHHPECPGVHPVCKVCRHCAFDGAHIDDAEDVRSGKYSDMPDNTPSINVN